MAGGPPRFVRQEAHRQTGRALYPDDDLARLGSGVAWRLAAHLLGRSRLGNLRDRQGAGNFVERAYFTGWTVFTLGIGDFKPGRRRMADRHCAMCGHRPVGDHARDHISSFGGLGGGFLTQVREQCEQSRIARSGDGEKLGRGELRPPCLGAAGLERRPRAPWQTLPGLPGVPVLSSCRRFELSPRCVARLEQLLLLADAGVPSERGRSGF